MADSNKYRQLASDCIRLSQTVPGGDREALLKMAEVWLELARKRESEQPTAKEEP